MAAPTYVAKKIGDRYVVVPKNLPATKEGSLWLAGGTVLAAAGLVRRGVCGSLMTLVGGGLIYRGVTGCNPFSRVFSNLLCGKEGEADRQAPSYQNDDKPARQAPQDEVDEASMESFPASDPPAKSTVATL